MFKPFKTPLYSFLLFLTIPGFAQQTTEIVSGSDIINNYIKAVGGENARKTIKDIKIKLRGVFDVYGNQMVVIYTEIKKTPGMYRGEMSIPGSTEMKEVIKDGKGYYEISVLKEELKGELLEAAMLKADLFNCPDPTKHKNNLKVNIASGPGKDSVYVVEIRSSPARKLLDYYSKQSGYLLKRELVSETAHVITEFSDYREVPGGNGYKIPYTVTTNFLDHSIPLTVESVVINTGIPDSEFN